MYDDTWAIFPVLFLKVKYWFIWQLKIDLVEDFQRAYSLILSSGCIPAFQDMHAYTEHNINVINGSHVFLINK